MPSVAKKKAVAPEAKKTKLNLQIREVLADAYSFVLGERFTSSSSAVGLEVLMQEQLNQIEGTDGKTEIRLNRTDALDKLLNSVSEVVRTVKQLPPSYFSLNSEDREDGNVNTTLDGEGEIPT